MPQAQAQVRSVLVTGGFGFLGRQLVLRLLEDDGACVHVVDDLSTSTLDVARFAARAAADRPGLLTYDVTTVAGYAGRALAFPGSHPRFDEIYHLASIVGPVGVLSHAGRIVGDVVGDVVRVMALAKRHGARLCDVSTSEVYGGGRAGACAETDPRVVPARVTVRLEYAVAKLAGEIAIENTAQSGEMSAVIVRPFNIAGPGQSAAGGFVLPRFVGQARSGQPLTVYGDGTAVRAFTHVTDVADGVVRAARRGRSPVYNLGRPANRTTILDLARRVLRATGSTSPIVHVDPCTLHGPRFAEAGDKFPDGDLAQRELDWHPTRDLDRIVADAIDPA